MGERRTPPEESFSRRVCILDVGNITRLSWKPQEAHSAYEKYLDDGEPGSLEEAWRACLGLVGRFYRHRSSNKADKYSGDDLVAGMSWALYDRLKRRKIPRFDQESDFANYLWRCCRNWFADGVGELSKGAFDVPQDWRPRQHAECEEWYAEWEAVKNELPSSVARRIRSLNPYGRSWRAREAISYIVDCLIADESPRRTEIRRIAGRKFDPVDLEVKASLAILQCLRVAETACLMAGEADLLETI